jgi:2-oxoglutarate dehydrogenase E2 component (dihydrolipoamide succinyltransferase)
MKVEIKVPVMGESVSEATVSSFLAPSGSYVASGQEIIELETDKVNQVLYAPNAGSISWLVSAGATVKIGEVIGSVDTEAKASPAAPQEKPPEKPTPIATGKETARKTGDDFLRSIEEPKAPEPKQASVQKIEVEAKATRKKMTGLRKTIAARLVEVKNKTAMLTTFNEIDMSTIMEIRSKEKDAFQERYGVKLGFMSFFVKACVAALKAYPVVNAMIDGDEIVSFDTYDIGVAVSTDKGLFVPVVKGCAELSFGEIEQNIASHAKKAREGSISVEDLKGGSFTITNGGVFGSLLSTPILNPPQSAILGMHSIVKRPVVLNDEIVIRPMMYVALSYDHRIIDGREAVLFLVHIKDSLENPAKLLLDL